MQIWSSKPSSGTAELSGRAASSHTGFSSCQGLRPTFALFLVLDV